MISLLQYSLAVAIPLTLFYVSYSTLIAPQKHFALNRSFLLAGYGLSLLSALWLFVSGPVVIRYAESGFLSVAGALPVAGAFSLVRLLSLIWMAGAAIIVVVTICEYMRIRILLNRCERISYQDRTLLLSPDERMSPFSIGNKLVISRSDMDDSCDAIIAHEEGHLHYRHTLDMLLAQLVLILCWYNPAAWMLRRELKTIHEYQADSFALSRGFDVKEYQLLLISKAMDRQSSWLGNSLNSSTLAKRIDMINRSVRPGVLMRMAYVIPIVSFVAGVFILFTPQVSAVVKPCKVVEAHTGESVERSPLDGVDVFLDGKQIKQSALNDLSASSIKAITVNKDSKRIDVETK